MAERKQEAQRIKPADLGHHSPSRALLALWERCEGSLRPDELLWFSSLGDSVEGGLHRVAETLDMVGIWADAAGSERPDREQLKAAMFALAESVRVLGSTAFVGAQATQLLREQGCAMRDGSNFLDVKESAFSDRVQRAALQGRLNADPLVGCLDSAARVSRGLSAIFRMARNNALQRFANEQAAAGGGGEPALCADTMEALFDLGGEAARMLARDIEQTAAWAETHGVREGKQ